MIKSEVGSVPLETFVNFDNEKTLLVASFVFEFSMIILRFNFSNSKIGIQNQNFDKSFRMAHENGIFPQINDEKGHYDPEFPKDVPKNLTNLITQFLRSNIKQSYLAKLRTFLMEGKWIFLSLNVVGFDGVKTCQVSIPMGRLSLLNEERIDLNEFQLFEDENGFFVKFLVKHDTGTYKASIHFYPLQGDVNGDSRSILQLRIFKHQDKTVFLTKDQQPDPFLERFGYIGTLVIHNMPIQLAKHYSLKLKWMDKATASLCLKI
jgi:hypothetical protein